MSDTIARIVTRSPSGDGAVGLADFDNTGGPDELDWERHWLATAALARALEGEGSIERAPRDEPLSAAALSAEPLREQPLHGHALGVTLSAGKTSDEQASLQQHASQQHASQQAQSGFCFVSPWRCRGSF